MKKKDIGDLIDLSDPAWPLVKKMISNSNKSVKELTTDRKHSEIVLLYLQVTTHSTLGAIALETGGLLIDHGWLRFLGSSNAHMQEDLLSWNIINEKNDDSPIKDALIVAHDVVGGFFALNGGAFSGKSGNIFYFAPDTLQWENINKSYTQFLEWALGGNLNPFYENVRWPNWEEEVAKLSGDEGISIYPFPFLNKEIPVSSRSRRVVPMRELWAIHTDFASQVGDLPPGAKIQFTLKRVQKEDEDILLHE